jgi:hypothetical protein
MSAVGETCELIRDATSFPAINPDSIFEDEIIDSCSISKIPP